MLTDETHGMFLTHTYEVQNPKPSSAHTACPLRPPPTYRYTVKVISHMLPSVAARPVPTSISRYCRPAAPEHVRGTRGQGQGKDQGAEEKLRAGAGAGAEAEGRSRASIYMGDNT